MPFHRVSTVKHNTVNTTIIDRGNKIPDTTKMPMNTEVYT